MFYKKLTFILIVVTTLGMGNATAMQFSQSTSSADTNTAMISTSSTSSSSTSSQQAAHKHIRKRQVNPKAPPSKRVKVEPKDKKNKEATITIASKRRSQQDITTEFTACIKRNNTQEMEQFLTSRAEDLDKRTISDGICMAAQEEYQNSLRALAINPISATLYHCFQINIDLLESVTIRSEDAESTLNKEQITRLYALLSNRDKLEYIRPPIAQRALTRAIKDMSYLVLLIFVTLTLTLSYNDSTDRCHIIATTLIPSQSWNLVHINHVFSPKTIENLLFQTIEYETWEILQTLLKHTIIGKKISPRTVNTILFHMAITYKRTEIVKDIISSKLLGPKLDHATCTLVIKNGNTEIGTLLSQSPYVRAALSQQPPTYSTQQQLLDANPSEEDDLEVQTIVENAKYKKSIELIEQSSTNGSTSQETGNTTQLTRPTTS